MSRYINPPPAPQSPIKDLHYGTPRPLDQAESHANVNPRLAPEDVSMWEGMNLGKNFATTMSRIAGIQAVDKEADRLTHPEQQTSSLGSPSQHKTSQGAKQQGALGMGTPQAWGHGHNQSTRRYASSGTPATTANLPAARSLPARGGHQPNVGSAYGPAISSQAALTQGTPQMSRYGTVQASIGPNDRFGRRSLAASPEAQQLLPGPEETRNKARAAQQRTFRDRAPKYEQGSMF